MGALVAGPLGRSSRPASESDGVRIRIVAAAVAASLVGWMAAAAVAGPATPRYPVPWTFAAGVAAGATEGPDVAPPGSNVACRPTAAHPYPVVLVHGLGADQNDNWQTISPFLADAGFCVFSLTYGNRPSEPSPFNKSGGLTDMVQSARQLGAFVQRVLARTGAAKVDIVGHSEGGTMPDWYIKFGGGYRYVDQFVVLAGALHGTNFWGMTDLYRDGEPYGMSQAMAAQMSPYCTACFEFFPFSTFISAVDSPHARGGAPSCSKDGAAVSGVRYTSIATNNDELVRPPTSGFIAPGCPGTRDILLQDQCPTDQADHVSVAADPVAATDILNALSGGRPRPVPCGVVAPGLGAPLG